MATIGSFPKRKSNREPLLTANEMAQELGLSMQSMLLYMRHNNGPKHEMVARRNATTITYFKPSEVRRWWQQLKESKA
jgi:predicted DNA-binding transcriptional regulator AlpA